MNSKFLLIYLIYLNSLFLLVLSQKSVFDEKVYLEIDKMIEKSYQYLYDDVIGFLKEMQKQGYHLYIFLNFILFKSIIYSLLIYHCFFFMNKIILYSNLKDNFIIGETKILIFSLFISIIN